MAFACMVIELYKFTTRCVTLFILSHRRGGHGVNSIWT